SWWTGWEASSGWRVNRAWERQFNSSCRARHNIEETQPGYWACDEAPQSFAGARHQQSLKQAGRLFQQSEVLIDLAGSRMERDGSTAVRHPFHSQVRECRMPGFQVINPTGNCLCKCGNGLCILTRPRHYDRIGANCIRLRRQSVHCPRNETLLEIGSA